MWVRDRLITSFNIYVYFPCKNIYIEKKNYDGVKIAGKLFFVFFSLISLHGEIFINAPLFTTYACVCIVLIFKLFFVCVYAHTHGTGASSRRWMEARAFMLCPSPRRRPCGSCPSRAQKRRRGAFPKTQRRSRQRS